MKKHIIAVVGLLSVAFAGLAAAAEEAAPAEGAVTTYVVTMTGVT